MNDGVRIGNKPNSLPRASIIRGKSRFTRLIQQGTVIRTSALVLRYMVEPSGPLTDIRYQAAFTISKRAGNAVRRNKIKRWMRESFRQEQFLLNDLDIHTSSILSLVFYFRGFNGKDGGFADIRVSMQSLLKRLVSRYEISDTDAH